jgi:hypothetical protein
MHLSTQLLFFFWRHPPLIIPEEIDDVFFKPLVFGFIHPQRFRKHSTAYKLWMDSSTLVFALGILENIKIEKEFTWEILVSILNHYL